MVYEHFGGKEGLYAVIVDRAIQDITATITDAISEPAGLRTTLERTALAMFSFMEESPSSVEVLVRSSPAWHANGSAASLMSAIAVHVEKLFEDRFEKAGYDRSSAPVYAQTLIGSIALTGSWWIHREDRPSKENVSAHLINLVWNGISNLSKEPTINGEPAPAS